jgi:hypothetical protein
MQSTAAATSAPLEPAPLVNLERYPILELDAPAARAVIRAAQAQLAAMGAAELPGFIRPEAMPQLVEDAQRLAPLAFRSEGAGTAYLEVPDFNLPEDHPRRMFGAYAVGVVAYDQIPQHSPLRRLYACDGLMDFIGAILDRGRLFRYADPLGALNLAVMKDGDELQWHFDMTDFVVSLAIQDAEQGGDFEVAPLIRSADDECYPRVKQVLDGASSEVVRLPMTPGTLLIFAGRHSIHRVSPIRGETPRLVALLAYDTKPGTNSTDVLKLSRYGRLA